MNLSYGSVCSGIEAASVAWQQFGWKAAWLSEIEPFPSAVLAHHYPNVPNLGDMTKIANKILSGEVVAPDILVGGTPCQAFSVAGLRNGLDDPRGALTISFVELANAIDTIRKQRSTPPPASSFGKTCLESSAQKITPSAAFWERSQEKAVSCNRQGSGGQTLVVCTNPKEQSRGGFSMPNISEWPNAAAVSLLSQALERGSIHLKYFLSSVACEGILRRAEKRGKSLPPMLEQALRQQASANIKAA